ncbi:hypothetical protein PRIPAC_85698 [Pristionchus pacificus]|uniref:YEATS domain-containing protein n=1 Tax=Pristionchus pacificus TaxID=54126 RepID=A0A454XV60_PRIPA|nr:hypothetical protein PRIPAC_85698 [Pristionchus pacificus]|eukprot:PDM66685.1 hypothetical protein PRIPAC_48102 [Pristionchus pacificus]
MGKSEARLLVRLQVGHRSELLEPDHPKALADGHTHRWTVYVRNQDGTDFQDRSFVEKVLFVLHVDFPNYKRTVKEPPYQVSVK